MKIIASKHVDMIRGMMQRVRELLVLLFLAVFPKAGTFVKPQRPWGPNNCIETSAGIESTAGASYCLSWRTAVEANNMEPWRTVPTKCLRYVETYITGGLYQHDLRFVVGQILSYVDTITLSHDAKDAFILDVDDTCISNVHYYKGKRYGGDPFDRTAFEGWALKEACPAIPAVLELFNHLVKTGFKVFLLTGRHEGNFRQATVNNLHNQGFVGYERLILRTEEHKGQSAVKYKTEIRKQLTEGEGYRLWGNVGDQWSDLQGQFLGNRTFKLPNPMYFVP